MDSKVDKRALTIQEAAEYACVSRGMILNWLTKRLLPYEELPGSGTGVHRFRRIRLADLDEFVDRSSCNADAFQGIRKAREVLLLPK